MVNNQMAVLPDFMCSGMVFLVQIPLVFQEFRVKNTASRRSTDGIMRKTDETEVENIAGPDSAYGYSHGFVRVPILPGLGAVTFFANDDGPLGGHGAAAGAA